MRILVCGDRNWADGAYLFAALDDLHAHKSISTVIEGEADGADLLGRAWAEARGIPFAPFPANWTKYHRAAGPIRNQQMLDEGKPEAVIAFHPDLTQSKGTADMVRRARRAELPTFVLPSEDADFGWWEGTL